MIRGPPRSTRTDTLFPYTTLFRSARVGLPSKSARLGVSVVRGRLPGSREVGRPSVSQNIWPRELSWKPSDGTVGEDCSQPPDGVAETMLPQRSMTSRWTVSPDLSRSEEHTSELQPLMRISSAVFCLKKKKQNTQ